MELQKKKIHKKIPNDRKIIALKLKSDFHVSRLKEINISKIEKRERKMVSKGLNDLFRQELLPLLEEFISNMELEGENV